MLCVCVKTGLIYSKLSQWTPHNKGRVVACLLIVLLNPVSTDLDINIINSIGTINRGPIFRGYCEACYALQCPRAMKPLLIVPILSVICLCQTAHYIWGHCCQKQVSQAEKSNYIPQFTVGCNYWSRPEIPASGNKVLILLYQTALENHWKRHDVRFQLIIVCGQRQSVLAMNRKLHPTEHRGV